MGWMATHISLVGGDWWIVGRCVRHSRMGAAMKRYRIVVNGSDDSTAIIVELSKHEAEIITRIALMITAASKHVWEPTMTVEEVLQ